MRYETVNTGTSHRLATVGDYSGEKGILNKITTRKDSCGSGEMTEAWAFYQGLADPEIIEVSVFETGEESADFTYKTSDSKEGSKLSGSGLMTDNPEYNEFINILKETGGELTNDIANALYGGQEIKVNDETHTITPDKSGTGWVFFKNTDANNKVKGHLIIDATNKRKDAVSSSIINATQTVSGQ